MLGPLSPEEAKACQQNQSLLTSLNVTKFKEGFRTRRYYVLSLVQVFIWFIYKH